MRPWCENLRQSNYFLFEIFLLFRFVALTVSAIASSLLIQDKICLVTYQQPAHFCQNIQADMNTTAQITIKDEILASATLFGNYKAVLECIPMFVWSMFVGSFLDNYPAGTNILLLLNILGNSFSLAVYIISMYIYGSNPYYLLIASISVSLTGGMISLLTTTYRYITINTSESNRNLKFVTLEIIYIIAIGLALYAGGQLLMPRLPSTHLPQLRTYWANFYTSLFFDLLSMLILYALNRVDKDSGRPKNLATLEDSIVYAEIENLLSSAESNNNYDSILQTSQRSIKNTRAHLRTASDEATQQFQRATSRPEGGLRNFFQSLFDLENVRQTLHTFFRPRAHRARLQIFLLYLILFSQVLTNMGIAAVALQFCEKVYNWDATMFSNVTAFTSIVSMTLLGVGSLLLVKKMQLGDGTLIVISQLSSFFRNILLGTFLTPLVYFISILVGSLSGFTVISARTKLSKIVETDEVGKIFSLSSTMDALIPLVGALIYSNLFTATISTYPGAIYQFSAFVMVLSLVVIVFEEYYCPVKSLNEPLQENGNDSEQSRLIIS